MGVAAPGEPRNLFTISTNLRIAVTGFWTNSWLNSPNTHVHLTNVTKTSIYQLVFPAKNTDYGTFEGCTEVRTPLQVRRPSC